MPKPEELEQLAQTLKSIATAGGAGGAKAERILGKVEARKVSIWAKKATSEDKAQQENARKTSQNTAKEDKGYSEKIGIARTNLESSLVANHIIPGDLPDFLPKDPKKILTTSIARLTERFAAVSPDFRKDPNFVLNELYTAYWATDWNSLTRNTAQEVWETINKGYDYALELAAQKPEYNNITLEFGPDPKKNRFYRSLDDRVDFYRTEKKVTGELQKVLREQQEVFDRYGEMTTEKEKEFLESFKTELAQKIADKKFTDTSVEPFRKKMDDRLRELERQRLPEKRAERPTTQATAIFEEEPELEKLFGKEEYEIPEMTPEEKKQFIQGIDTPAFKTRAQEILDTLKSKDVKEIEEILRELSDPDRIISQIYEDAEARLKAGNPARVVTTEERIAAMEGDLARLRVLQFRVREQTQLYRKDMPSFSYWYVPEGKEDLKKMTIDFVDFGDHEENIEAFRVWDRIQEKLLFVADKRQYFQQAGWTFYREQDLEGFYTILRRRLNQFKENPDKYFIRRKDGTIHTMDDDKIQRILSRFYQYRDFKEMFHNFRVIAETGSGDAKEQLAKYASTFMDQDGNYLMKNIRGVELAMHLQEGGMDWIATLNDGRLPNEAMAEVNGVSQWKDHYKDQFRRWIAGVQGRTEPYFAHFQGMEEWEIQRALDMAFGFNIVNMNLPMWLTRVKGARGYRSRYADNITYDGIRSPYLKFETEKQALPILYQILTADLEGTEKIKNAGWSIDDIFEQIYFGEGDRLFEERMAGYRNFADISSRQGYGSVWGADAQREVWPRELFKHRGVGARLQDAQGRIEKDLKALIKGKIKGESTRTLEASLDAKYSGWKEWNKTTVRYETKKFSDVFKVAKVRARPGTDARIDENILDEVDKRFHEIQRAVQLESQKILEEAIYLIPGTIAQRMVDDHLEFHKLKNVETPNERIWALIEEILGEDRIIEMFGDEKLVLESSNYPGGRLELNVKESFRRRANGKKSHSIIGQLWVALPKNKDGIVDIQEHITHKQLTKAEQAYLKFVKYQERLTGDLELVQQMAVTRIDAQAKMGRDVGARIENGNFQKKDWGDWGIIQGDNAPRRMREAKLFMEGILDVAKNERAADGTTFLERFAKRVARKQERALFTTVDAPWEAFDYARMGGRGYVRALGDANYVYKGLMGITPFMKQFIVGAKQEDLAQTLKKEVYDPIAMYYDGEARAFCGPIIERTAAHFGENRFYSYTGLFPGDFLATNAVQKWMRNNRLYRLMASQSKVFIGYHAQAWGPNEEHKWIEICDGLNMLPKGVLPKNWGFGRRYSSEDIEKRRRATPTHAFWEYVSYVPLAGLLIMAIEGFRESTKEEK